MSKVISRETAYKRIRDILGKDYRILSDDLNENTFTKGSVELKHITCGNTYITKITNVTDNKRKCTFCSSNRTYTKDEEVVSLLGDEYSLVGEFKGYSKVNKVRHNKCGIIRDIKPNLICNGKSKCQCINSEHKSSPKGVFTKEEWKTIDGTGYKISNTGKVKNKHNKLLKPSYDLGYIRYNLFINGKQKRFFAHRLVAKYFIPNPDNLPIVNHVDENPSNPRVDNLQWCTTIYNNNYGNAITKRKHNQIGKPIYALFDDGTDMYFDALTRAEEYFGGSVTVTHIGHVLDGTQKTTGGLRFELA